MTTPKINPKKQVSLNNQAELDRARRRAAEDEIRPGETTLATINRLEDERGALWAAGISREAQRARLEQINAALTGLWAIRREERSGERIPLEPATAHRDRGAWAVDPWAGYLGEDA